MNTLCTKISAFELHPHKLNEYDARRVVRIHDSLSCGCVCGGMSSAKIVLLALVASSSAFFLPASERRIGLRDLSSEQRAVSAIRNLASMCGRWGPNEYKVFGVPAMKFSSRQLPTGVSLQFYNAGSGALTENGSIELTLQESNIIIRTVGGSGGGRGKQSELLYQLMLDDIRDGVLSDECSLSLGLHPPTGRVGTLRRKIEGACRYDKKGQYERF